MKGLSYILAFFVVFLTIQPTIALANEKPESDCCCSSCCDEEDNAPKDSKQNKTDCTDQNCNPFQACGCCIGFVLKTSFLKIEQSIAQSSMPIILKENSTSQYSPKVWQPPKIS